MSNRPPIPSLLAWAVYALGIGPLFAAPQEPARDYLVHVWQTDNGLPQNWVSSIAQTPDGYLWIGTRYGGLARFDGVRFVNFNPQTTPELKDVQVEHLSVDQTGALWVIMGNESITVFENGMFQLVRLPRSEPRLRADHVLTVHSNQVLFAGEDGYLAQLNRSATTNEWRLFDPRPNLEPEPVTFSLDGSGVVWCVTRDHRLLRFVDGRFDLMTNAPGLPEPTAVALTTDAARLAWVATTHHLALWDGQGFVDRTPTNGPAPENILRIAFSGDGGLWVLEPNRLRKSLNNQWVAGTKPAEFQPEIGSDTEASEFSLHGDAQGNAWLVSYGHGLWHVKSDGSASLLTENTGLPSAFIKCWFQDDEGDVWIGTAGGGIARVRESLFRSLGQAKGLPGKVVRSVCVDKQDTLWAGTMSGGLACWKGGRFEPVPLPGPNPTESVTVFPASDGTLWIGTLNHGLMRLQSGLVTRGPIPENVHDIRVLFGDTRGQLWVGRLVNLFSVKNDHFTTFGAAEGFVDSHAIGALAEDATGALWIGTGPGDLWKFYQGRFTRFTPPAEWPSVRFSAVLPETNGTVWVGTLGGGLLRFRDGRFTRCTKQNGLPDDNVSQLLDSGDGHLWAGTYAGIFRASKAELDAAATGRTPRVACRAYGTYDGLPSLECSSGFQPSCWRSTEGRLYFSTANGVVTVDPLAITANRAAPKVIIEEMLVDGRPRPLSVGRSCSRSGAPLESRLQIEPGRHYVQFGYTGLNFAAPDGVRFRVKLEGVDRDWQNVGGQRSIGYGPLLPGTYEFRVMACNNEGVWNEQGDALAFAVLPFFWETWWFKTALALATLTSLGVVVALAQRRRYRLKLERVERQREMEHERTRIAQDLHDDLGTSLTQISMLSALANREQTPAHETRELIQQVRGRAREMVTALDEIVWAVNPKNDSLVELVNYLGHFAEEFFRPTGIRCRLDFPEQLPPRALASESRHHLFLAFKEAVNNAARHSRATEVQVRVTAAPDELIIYVEDNGEGFLADDPNRRGGNGLTNMQHRMKQAGGNAVVRSAPGQGTTVALRLALPLGG